MKKSKKSNISVIEQVSNTNENTVNTDREPKSAKKLKKKDKKIIELTTIHSDDPTDTDFQSPPTKSHKKKRQQKELSPETKHIVPPLQLDSPKSGRKSKHAQEFNSPKSDKKSKRRSLEFETPKSVTNQRSSQEDVLILSSTTNKKRKHSSQNDDCDEAPYFTKEQLRTHMVENVTPKKKKSKRDDSDNSTAKKKKSASYSLSNCTIESIDDEVTTAPKIEDRYTEEAQWNIEEHTKLLSSLQTQLQQTSQKPSEKDFLNINWEIISDMFEGTKSPKQCADEVKAMTKSVKKMRNGFEVILATQRKLAAIHRASVHRNVPVNAGQLLGSRNKIAVKEIARKKNVNYFTACNMLFASCSKEDRVALQEELAHMRSKKSNVKMEKKPTPYSIYLEENKEKLIAKYGRGTYFSAGRSKYTKLSNKKKFPYLRKAVERLENMLPEAGVDGAEIDPSLINLSKPEIQMYLTEGFGMPKLPPVNSKSLYLKSHPEKCKNFEGPKSGSAALSHGATVWDQVDKKEKSEWMLKAKRGMTKYKEAYIQWENDATPLNRQLALYYHGKATLQKRYKPITRSRDLYQAHTIQQPTTRVKFLDEPTAPMKKAFTASNMYLEKQRLKGSKVSVDDFAQLSEAEKQKYEESAKDLKSKYAQKLIDFAEGLSEDRRAMYLGFDRLTYIRLFKKDIFEHKFPVATYNVYVPQTLKAPSVKVISTKTMEDELQKSFRMAGVLDSSDDEDADSDDSIERLISLNKTSEKAKIEDGLQMASQLHSQSTESDSSE